MNSDDKAKIRGIQERIDELRGYL